MKFPLSWLKEYIDISLPANHIAKILTSAGIEVDSVEVDQKKFENIIVGRVVETQKHPNADKLCIAKVTDGAETYQVVCGAANCRPGLKTAFAKIGATLTDENGKVFKIKQSKIRDVESFGMLCSEDELLHTPSDQDGIIEFDEHIKEGVDVAELYADPIFEVSLTPNLGHCSCLIGIARELSAAIKEPLQFPIIYVKEEDQPTISLAKVTVEDVKKCPRYSCRLIKNVKIGPSPDWMQKRLLACGVRPINNIVDITNYVLLEMGQPMHAFDFDKIQGHEIVVRSAKEGEKFITLDEKERVLTSEDLLICDKGTNGTRPIAIAGVMGGQNSEVSDTTTNVLLESAYFLPSSVRRTSKRLGLSTDASKRFERGGDPNIVLQALDRAAMLMETYAQGKVCKGHIDSKSQEFPQLLITCRLSRINQILGTKLSVGEVEDIFLRLGFAHKFDGQNSFQLEIPTYRADIKEEIDIIEEVARIYGYDNIPKAPGKFHNSTQNHAPIFVFERKVRSRLLAEGLQELLTCDLIGPTLLNTIQYDSMPPESVIHVLNPTSVEQSILRTSLLPGLLQVVKYNFDHQTHNVSGFEIGRIHFKDKDQYKEQTVAGIVMTGHSRPYHWDQKPREVDFYDLKGILENLLKMLGVKSNTFKISDLKILHNGRQSAIFVGELEIGAFGEVHPAICKRLDVPQRILFAEINLHDLYQVLGPSERVHDLSIYPSSERDWTVTIREDILIQEVFDKIRQIPSKLLEEVTLLDIYKSEKLGKGIRNATFHFVYRDKTKTIAQDAVDAEHARLINKVTEYLGV